MKRFFTLKLLRRSLLGIALLVTIIGLVLAFEGWRGKRAWNKYKTELLARGEKLDWQEFIPPQVPDEQNFAMAPVFQAMNYKSGAVEPEMLVKKVGIEAREQGSQKKLPKIASPQAATITDLTQWKDFYIGNTNYPGVSESQSPAEAVLTALSRFDDEIKDFREAATRPYSRFPLIYEDNISMNLPHLTALKGATRVLELRAIAELEQGKSAEALNDMKLAFRLADSIKDEPLMICYLVRLSMWATTVATVKEGIARHAWSESDLKALQQSLSEADILSGYRTSVAGERAFSIEIMELMRQRRLPPEILGDDTSMAQAATVVPSGWLYQNTLTLTRWHQEITLPAVDPEKHTFNRDVLARGAEVIGNKNFAPYELFARMLFPAFMNCAKRTAHNQTLIDQAMVSCALERFYLVEHKYPETLNELTPRYLKTLPPDVVTGKPIRYERTPNGFYRLYSVGWDGKDNGGTLQGKDNDNDYDWVWQYPEKK